MIELAFPLGLLLFPAPLLVRWLVPPHRERMTGLRIPFFRRIAVAIGGEPGSGSVVLRRCWVEILVAMAVWVALVIAIARPERVGDPIEVTKAARDIVLAIDISGSMDEIDFPALDGTSVQRLEGVKRVVGRFVADREGDRVALIVFGDKAFIQSPFTEDLETVRGLLEQTEVGMAGPRTVIGDAIGLAIHIFETSEIRERLLIVLSDGTDTGSRMSPLNAAVIAASNNVEIITVAVGDPDGQGEQQVDVGALEEIAVRSGGQFFFAQDEAGLEAIYARIDAMSPRRVESISFRPRESLGVFPLAAAALIGLLGAGGLSRRSLRRTLV